MKKQQLSFVVDGTKYLTFDGDDSGFLKSKANGSNVISYVNIKTNAAVNAAYKYINLQDDINDIPVIENAAIMVNDNIYEVSGTAIIDGVSVNVKITQLGNIIGPATIKNSEPVVEQEEFVESAITEQEEVVEEPIVQEESAVEFVVQEEVIEEPVIQEEVEEQTEEQEVEEEKTVIPEPKEPFVEFMNPPVEKVNKKSFTWGTRKQDGITDLDMGQGHGLRIGSVKVKAGIHLHGDMPEPNTSENYRNRRLNTVSVTGRPVFTVHGSGKTTFMKAAIKQVEKPEQELDIIPVPEVQRKEPTEEELMENWKNTAEMDLTKKWEAPKEETVSEIVKEEETVATEEADYKAAKEAIRATLSDEVNMVIGDIPHSLLGSIPEFTTRDVDVDSLSKNKDLYCIDNRWHKCGKWFCIDIVPNTSRYFFNSRKNVSIEIPIEILKKWGSVVVQNQE